MRLALLSISLLLLAACMAGGGSAPSESASASSAKTEPAPASTPAATVASADDLAAHDWQLAGEAVQPRPWLRFADGQLGGNTSCNGLNGAYTADAGRLSFGPLAQSKRFCTATADQERRFMDALRRTQGYRIGTGQLELLDGNGQLLITLEARTESGDAP